jgi:4-hydroxybenzoate polyprenyltransferase
MQKLRFYLKLVLDLLRLDMVAAAVSHIWLMTLLAGSSLEPAAQTNPALSALGLPLSLALGAVIGLGLAGCGMALNDALDARHDRAFAPERPIPAGRVTQRAALALALGCLLAAGLAAVPLGPASMLMTLIAAGAIVFYNFTGRFMPAVGIVTLGVIQGLVMAIPNPGFTFGWPAALAVTHVMGCEAGRYRLAGKRPSLSGRRSTWLLMGWMFAVLAVLGLMSLRGTLEGPAGQAPTVGLWVGPLVAVVLFVLVVRWQLDRKASGPAGRANRRSLATLVSQLGMLWLAVYDAVWLVGGGLYWQAGLIAALLGVTVLLMRVQRWLSDAAAAPPAYRVRPREPGPGQPQSP